MCVLEPMKGDASKLIVQNTVSLLSQAEAKLSPVCSPDSPSLPREPVCPLNFSSFRSDPRDFSPAASQPCQSACSFQIRVDHKKGEMPWRSPGQGEVQAKDLFQARLLVPGDFWQHISFTGVSITLILTRCSPCICSLCPNFPFLWRHLSD